MNEQLPLLFEPKRLNRFILSFVKKEDNFGITGLYTWTVRETQRPAIEYINNRKTCHPITIVFCDPIGPSASQAVFRSFNEREVFSYVLEMLDPVGNIVERWEIRDCKIIGVDFGNLSYDDGGITQVTVVVKPSEAELIF